MTVMYDVTEYDVDKAIGDVKEMDAVLHMIFLLWKGRLFLSFIGSKIKDTVNVDTEEFSSWSLERQVRAIGEWWDPLMEHLNDLASQILQHVHQKTVTDALDKWTPTLNDYYTSFPQFDNLLEQKIEAPALMGVAIYDMARNADKYQDRDRKIVGTVTEPMFKLYYQRIKILGIILSRYTIQHAVPIKKRRGKHRPQHTFTICFHGRLWKAKDWNKYLDKLMDDLQTNGPIYSNLSTVVVSCTLNVEQDEGEKVTESEDDNLCSVCLCYLDIDDTVAPFKCSHEFHRECMSAWIHFKESADCPMCRAVV